MDYVPSKYEQRNLQTNYITGYIFVSAGIVVTTLIVWWLSAEMFKARVLSFIFDAQFKSRLTDPNELNRIRIILVITVVLWLAIVIYYVYTQRGLMGVGAESRHVGRLQSNIFTGEEQDVSQSYFSRRSDTN